MKNAIPFVLLSLLIPSYATALSIHLPRSPFPKGGGGGGGGGRGGGSSSGGGRSSGSSSSSGGSRSTGAGNTGRGGSGNTGRPAIVPTTSGSSAGRGRAANYFSRGGGQSFTLDSSSVFAGRKMGGGTRDQVVGTPRYGSGYPYYVGTYPYGGVIGQPFPFGFWPIYWGGHGHGDEYHHNSTVNSQRPGGNLTMIEVSPNDGSGWGNRTINGANETYWMIGDFDSVTTLLSLLVDPANSTNTPYGCSCKNVGPYTFDTDGNTTNLPVHFENVIQWYRSSSFALAFAGYNNTNALAPLNETGTLGWNDSVPISTDLANSAFLRCVNNTITAALPIVDAPPSKGLSPGAIAGIVIGSIAGAIILPLLVWFLWVRRQKREALLKKKKKHDSKIKEHSDSQPNDASASALVQDSPARAGWVGGFFRKKSGPNADSDEKADIDGKKGPVDDTKKKKGPVDEHKEKSSHRDTVGDESPNAGITFPEPKVI